jgi:hypothetical protein
MDREGDISSRRIAMSDMQQQAQQAGQHAAAPQVPRQTRGMEERSTGVTEPTGWSGWLVFAAAIMIMVGAFQVIAGLTALLKSGYYLVGEQELVVNVDYTAWGWVHIGLGALAVAAAFGLMAGQMWARIVGITMAVVSAVINLAFIPAYPLWSIIVIALDVVVIYAIAAHGDELTETAY